MVNSFSFSHLPELHFGIGTIGNLPQIIKRYGTNCLVITGKASFLKSEVGHNLLLGLKLENIDYLTEQIAEEPTVLAIDNIVSRHYAKPPHIVVAIGGGSVIDAGKAVSAMLKADGSIKNYLEGITPSKVHSGNKIPFIACPTTSGTGSEATKNAVISQVGANGFKRSLRHSNFIPNIALIDPQLTVNCPPTVTAASGLDALTQLLESYTSTAATPLTDIMAFEGIKHVVKVLPEAVFNGTNLEARGSMSYSAYLSGVCLANAGLGAVHGFASSVGAYYNIPHGVICGSLLGVTNELNVKKALKTNNANLIAKYANIGKLFCSEQNKSDFYYALTLIHSLNNMVEELGMPKFGKYGLKAGDIGRIIDETGVKNNPVPLTKEELAQLLQSRI